MVEVTLKLQMLHANALQAVTNLLGSFATHTTISGSCLGCLQATEVEAMAKLQVPHAMKPQAVTNLLWSFASLRYYPAKLLDFLVSTSVAAELDHTSTVLLVLAAGTYKCDAEVLKSLMQCCQRHQ